MVRVTVQFFVPGLPQPAGSKRGFVVGGHVNIVDANSKSKDWKRLVSAAAAETMRGRPPTRAPVSLELVFLRPRPKAHYDARGNVRPRFLDAIPISKPDSLKLARGTEDAMTGIVYCDDAQVYKITSEKQYHGRPGVEVLATWDEPEGQAGGD